MEFVHFEGLPSCSYRVDLSIFMPCPRKYSLSLRRSWWARCFFVSNKHLSCSVCTIVNISTDQLFQPSLFFALARVFFVNMPTCDGWFVFARSRHPHPYMWRTIFVLSRMCVYWLWLCVASWHERWPCASQFTSSATCTVLWCAPMDRQLWWCLVMSGFSLPLMVVGIWRVIFSPFGCCYVSTVF